MATTMATGPAHVFLGIGANGAPLYLGTTEHTPRIRVRPGWSPVFNDIAGGVIPYDMVYEGEEAFISGDWNRYNEQTLSIMQARPRHNATGSVRGVNIAGDIGTLMLTEGQAYAMYLYFPYSSKPAYVAAGMPAGYHFYAVFLEGPDDMDRLGTIDRINRLQWHALRVFNSSIPTLPLTLYDLVLPPMPQIN